jgi:hypothetical protein
MSCFVTLLIPLRALKLDMQGRRPGVAKFDMSTSISAMIACALVSLISGMVLSGLTTCRKGSSPRLEFYLVSS